MGIILGTNATRVESKANADVGTTGASDHRSLPLPAHKFNGRRRRRYGAPQHALRNKSSFVVVATVVVVVVVCPSVSAPRVPSYPLRARDFFFINTHALVHLPVCKHRHIYSVHNGRARAHIHIHTRYYNIMYI